MVLNWDGLAGKLYPCIFDEINIQESLLIEEIVRYFFIDWDSFFILKWLTFS